MTSQFHSQNRKELADKLLPGSLALVFSGKAPLKTGDEDYPFFAERNFVYLTGITEQSLILMIRKEESGEWSETLFIRPPDMLKERWTGKRIRAEEAEAFSGIRDIKQSAEFDTLFNKLANSGRYSRLCLDLFKFTPDKPDDEAYLMVKYARNIFPAITIVSIRPIMKSLRLLKFHTWKLAHVSRV